MIQTVCLLAKPIDFFSYEQNSGLEISYKQIVKRRMTQRLEDFMLEELLSVFECYDIGLQHDDGPRPRKIVAANG